MNQNKNLIKRNGIWYFKKMVDGREERVSLQTSDVSLARARRNSLAKKMVGERWAEIDGVKQPRKMATLAEVFEVYEKKGLARDLDPKTVANNQSALTNIINQVKGDGFDALNASVSVLTPELLHDFEELVLKRAGKDYLAKEQAKRTIGSTVVQARSIFAKWTREIYQDLALPDLTKFREAVVARGEVKVYRLPAHELIERTIEGGRRLKERKSEAAKGRYLAFLCCYDLGLRAGEAAALKFDWFEVRPVKDSQGNIAMKRVLRIVRRADFKPKWNKEREIPVGDELWAHLTAGRHLSPALSPKGGEGEDKHVLPGGCHTARENLVGRKLARWMRLLGWKQSEYTKAAHELRKLMGSRWYTELGAEVAQEWLGHRNVATTCSFYAALRSQPKALSMEGLKLQAAA